MNFIGTLILSVVSLLERLSYYGVRAILILYVTDTNGLNISVENTLAYYGNWAIILICISIPISLITDKVLGQRRSIYCGGILCLIGYSLLIFQSKTLLIIGLILILIGTSFVKPSTTILIGRQFKKENKNRTLAFMIFFLGINIGAFIGVAGIGYIGEVYEWKYGFIIAAISTLSYLLGMYFLRSHIIESETNETISPKFNLTLGNSIKILPILVLINIVFWKSHDLGTTELIINLPISTDSTLFGIEILESMLQSFASIWTIPLTVGLFFYWYLKGVTNFFKSIRFSLTLLIFAILATSIISSYETKHLLELSMIPLGLYAFAEVIISPMITSYVTRISDVKYSNTLYSVFIFLTYLIGVGFVHIFQNDFQIYWILAILALTIIGLLINRDQISKLTHEIK